VTDIEFERLAKTEKRALGTELKSKLVKEIGAAFTDYKTITGTHRNAVLRATDILKAFDTEAKDKYKSIAYLTAPSIGRTKLVKAVEDYISFAGTVNDMLKGSSEKSANAINIKFGELITQQANDETMRKAVIGTRQNAYMDGVIGQVIRSKELAFDTCMRVTRQVALLKLYGG